MSFGRNEAHVTSHQVTPKLGGGTYNRYSRHGGYWFDDLRQAYQYPSYETMVTVNGNSQRLDGNGATIGVLCAGLAPQGRKEEAGLFEKKTKKLLSCRVECASHSTISAEIPVH
jgi:hypothetical protein